MCQARSAANLIRNVGYRHNREAGDKTGFYIYFKCLGGSEFREGSLGVVVPHLDSAFDGHRVGANQTRVLSLWNREFTIEGVVGGERGQSSHCCCRCIAADIGGFYEGVSALSFFGISDAITNVTLHNYAIVVCNHTRSDSDSELLSNLGY